VSSSQTRFRLGAVGLGLAAPPVAPPRTPPALPTVTVRVGFKNSVMGSERRLCGFSVFVDEAAEQASPALNGSGRRKTASRSADEQHR
jgi:hypothetical protein